MHRDPDQQVAAPPDGGPETPPLAADDDGDGPTQVGLAGGERGVAVGADDPQAAGMQVREGAGQVVDRGEAEVLHGTGRSLHGGRR